MSGNNGDDVSSSGAVELREDIPLKPSASRGGAGKYLTGIRFVVGCFSVLTAAITVALATQIYYGDYQLVPHGSVASDSAACSRAGTDALKAGGGAADAAVAAALCLAVLHPHNTGLDAGGSLMLYDYRSGRGQGPLVVDWSGATSTVRPRLVAGLAWLHVRYGKLAWRQLVEPAVKLARGFSVSSGLAAATQVPGRESPYGVLEPGQTLKLDRLAEYLQTLANKTDVELETLSSAAGVSTATAMRSELGGGGDGSGEKGYLLYTPPARPAANLLTAALRNVPYNYGQGHDSDDQLILRTASALQQALRTGGGVEAVTAGAGAATNIAVIDKDDVYVSLVTGLSSSFGSRTMDPSGFLLDDAAVPALTPVMLTDNYTCGHRYVLGSRDVCALAQVLVRLLAGEHDLITSVEDARFHIQTDSTIGIEDPHNGRMFSPSALQYLSSVGLLRNATEPYASCNVVQQTGDALSSHADSRGGGIAYRF